MHTQVGDSRTTRDDRSARSFGDQRQVIRAEVSGVTVNREGRCPGLNKDQNIHFVVDVRVDPGAGVEANEIGVEVPTVGQAPNGTTRTHRHRPEVGDEPTGDEVGHWAATVIERSISITMGNNSLFSL